MSYAWDTRNLHALPIEPNDRWPDGTPSDVRFDPIWRELLHAKGVTWVAAELARRRAPTDEPQNQQREF